MSASTPDLLDARVDARDCGPTLVLPLYLAAPRARVWEHLTQPALLAEWAPFIPSRPLGTVGDVDIVQLGMDGTPELTLPGAEQAAEDGELLHYTWGADTLVWELANDDAGTAVTLSHCMTDATQAASLAAGWQLCLGVLADRLAGKDTAPRVGQAALDHGWQELHDRYESRFAAGA